MKRFYDGAYGASASEKKDALSSTIKYLTASQSDGTLPSDQEAIPPRKLSRHEHFVHRIHRMLARGKGNIYEAQRTDTEVQEKGSILELKNQIEILKNQIEIHGKRFEKLEGQNKCEHRLESNILERTSVPFPGTKLIGKQFEWNSAKIIGWLKNPGASTIGVGGMGGIGKTALLKHICNKLIQDNTFSEDVYWLTVSKCDTVYKWQASIAKCFGFDLSNEDDELKRAMVLRRTLAKRRSIVLIVDDMWHPFIPDEVGIFPRESGWKIILNNRLLEVCQRMGCKDLVIKLTVFSMYREEHMKLFVDKIEGNSALTEEVKTTAKEIVERCGGLPLAIVTMSYCMKGVTDIYEWEDTLYGIKIRKHSDMITKVLSELRYSFDRLNDEMAKNCFLSSKLHFAGECEFGERCRSKRWLIKCWINEGLLGDERGNYQALMSKGLAILTKLANLSLLGQDHCYAYMHHLIGNMAIHFAPKSQPHFKIKVAFSLTYHEEVPGEELWSEDLVKVYLCHANVKNIPNEMSPKCSKLTVLCLHHNPLVLVPECFFVHMKALKVLDLSYTDIESLPNSVCNLKNLQTLLVEGCEKLAHVPPLTVLMKLKVLSLMGSWKIEVPMVIENLKSLEMLRFSWNVSDLTRFNRVMQSEPFYSLLDERNFVLFNGEFDVNLHRCDVRFVSIPEVKFNRIVSIADVEFSDQKTVILPHNIELLDIRGSHIKSLHDTFPSLRDGTCLKWLEIYGCEGVEYIFSAAQEDPSIFPAPTTHEYLEIEGLPNLRVLVEQPGNGTPELPALSSPLKRLYIGNCSKMRNVFSLNLVNQSFCFSHLQSGSVCECEDLEEIFELIDKDVSVPIDYDGALPNLRDL